MQQNHQNRQTEPLPKKRDLARYLLIIPLVILAGWLLKQSFWLKDNDHQAESPAIAQQENLERIEREVEDENRKDKDFNFTFNFDGEELSDKDKEKLEKLGEKLGRLGEKLGEELEKNLKDVVITELNESLRDWKKRDLPKLKRDLKKLKKDLRREIKDNLSKEFKNLDKRGELDKHERKLLKNLKEIIESIEID